MTQEEFEERLNAINNVIIANATVSERARMFEIATRIYLSNDGTKEEAAEMFLCYFQDQKFADIEEFADAIANFNDDRNNLLDSLSYGAIKKAFATTTDVATKARVAANKIYGAQDWLGFGNISGMRANFKEIDAQQLIYEALLYIVELRHVNETLADFARAMFDLAFMSVRIRCAIEK